MQHISFLCRSVILTALIVVTGCQPPTPSSCGGCDLTVSNLEVTQAIQTTTNTIQLVAQRSTAVRAIIGVSGVSGSVSGVTGRLHVLVGGVEITPAAGIAPINAPFTAPLTPQRANEIDTLNFELAAPTGITASTNVTFRVDITPMSDETNTSNNSLTTASLTVVNRTTPSVYFTRIDWTPSGLGLPAIADIQPGIGDAFVRGIYPVNDGDPNLYRQGLFPTLTFTEDGNSDGVLDAAPEGNNLLALLASCRQLIVSAGLGANNNTFLYGWIRDNPINGNGLGQVFGFNAYGNTELIRYQRTFAHELGHNFGNPASHNTRTLDEVGWDVGARLDSNPAGNNTTGRVKPTSMKDINFGGQLTNAAWVDTITYNFFLSSSILAFDSNRTSAHGGLFAIAQPVEEFSERVAVIQGIFNPEGTELVNLEPAFRFPWPSQPTSLEQEGRFVAEVVDSEGGVTQVHFDALIHDDSEGEGKELTGFFEVMVPVSPNLEVVSIRITDAAGEQVFGELKSSQPPEIVIVAPEPGAQLGEQTEVAWEVQDPDTPLEELLYQVAYSPNGGENWVPIAVDVNGTENGITFDSTQIQESRENGVIRVFVSDGLNTAFADVDGLTTTAAQYPPP